MINEFHWARIKWDMSLYDQLSPEMRAVVQEYGELPSNPLMPVEEFRQQQARRQQTRQHSLLAA